MLTNEQITWCNKYIRNDKWKLNENGRVDVQGNVIISNKNLSEIPVNFGYVTGDFSIYKNNLKNLRGCPVEVGGKFFCGLNPFETLEGCPKEIGGNFNAYGIPYSFIKDNIKYIPNVNIYYDYNRKLFSDEMESLKLVDKLKFIEKLDLHSI